MKKFVPNSDDSDCRPPPPDTSSEPGTLEYEVAEIIGKKRLKRKIYYLVTWKGYPEEETSWEPLENLKNCKDLVEEFEQARKVASRPE